MKYDLSDKYHDFDCDDVEADLWFLPPAQDADDRPPWRARKSLGPPPDDAAQVQEWAQEEAQQAARLARVAGRLGALDDRMRRGPAGWRHRLALIETAELSWFTGDRVTPDRLALWLALRVSRARDEAGALWQAGWAARRLIHAEGAPETALAAFLGRQDAPGPQPPAITEAAEDPFALRAAQWQGLMAAGHMLHPITRACMGFHLWAPMGLAPVGDLGHMAGRMEATVTAARIAAPSASFAPLVMGGGGVLRSQTGGPPTDRLGRWLEGMDGALLAAMRHLDRIEDWSARARVIMAPLSGRTPPALCAVLSDWPLVSAPMAARLTGSSRTAVQRNLVWMQTHGLTHEVTGQGRFRMWRAAL
ncbi:MAG: hypothetical protein ACPG7W_00445 [Paracoccaceae bacterium]